MTYAKGGAASSTDSPMSAVLKRGTADENAATPAAGETAAQAASQDKAPAHTLP